MLREIGIPLLKAPQLFCYNMSPLHMFINPIFHVKTKHIEMDYHFIREKVALEFSSLDIYPLKQANS